MMKYLKYIICAVLLLSTNLFAQQTKFISLVEDWSELAQNSMDTSATIDVSGMLEITLYLELALGTGGTAHTDGAVYVQASSNTVATDEDWTDVLTIPMPTGTPNIEALSNSESAGATVLEVTSTTGYEADGGRFIFIEDNTVISSEIVYLRSHEGTPSVTLLGGIQNAHTSADNLLNIATSRAYPINVSSFVRLRILLDNTAMGAAGSTVYWRLRESNIKSIQ